MFQKKIAYGKFPWSKKIYKGKVSYKKGTCQLAEKINEKEYLGLHLYKYDYNFSDISRIVSLFKKFGKKTLIILIKYN